MHICMHVCLPTVAWYLPAVQLVQMLVPVVAEYVPASQAVQVLATEAPVVGEYAPASQSAQLEEPTVAWNLPAVQLVQPAVSPTENLPAAQDMQL